MNSKHVDTAKKIVRKVPTRAIESGAVLLIGKALGGKRKLPAIAGTLAAIVITHYIVEWATEDK